MPQAITTKFIPVTNTKGSRVSAKCEAGRIILSWDHALNSEDNHKAAAMALIKKLGWDDRKWAYGSAGRNSRGETFVPVLDYNVIKPARRKGQK
jgi:hypothetical protein